MEQFLAKSQRICSGVCQNYLFDFLKKGHLLYLPYIFRLRTIYVQTCTYIVHTDPLVHCTYGPTYIQCTSMSVNRNRTHNDFGYLGENLSEP